MHRPDGSDDAGAGCKKDSIESGRPGWRSASGERPRHGGAGRGPPDGGGGYAGTLSPGCGRGLGSVRFGERLPVAAHARPKDGEDRPGSGGGHSVDSRRGQQPPALRPRRDPGRLRKRDQEHADQEGASLHEPISGALRRGDLRSNFDGKHYGRVWRLPLVRAVSARPSGHSRGERLRSLPCEQRKPHPVRRRVPRTNQRGRNPLIRSRNSRTDSRWLLGRLPAGRRLDRFTEAQHPAHGAPGRLGDLHPRARPGRGLPSRLYPNVQAPGLHGHLDGQGGRAHGRSHHVRGRQRVRFHQGRHLRDLQPGYGSGAAHGLC